MSSSIVYTWGCGKYGVLLQEGEQDLAHPTPIRGCDTEFDLSTFRMYGSTCVLWDHDGILYSFGWGNWGQLFAVGHANRKNYPKPKKIAALSKERIVAVAGGVRGRHTIFLSFVGHVWGCGDNRYWQAVGCKMKNDAVLVPTRVSLPELVTKISVGEDFSGSVNEARTRIFTW